MASKKIAVVPGDGIGVDVTAEAVKVLQACCDVTGNKLELIQYDWGAEKYLKTGISVPPDGYDLLRSHDAIFMGAFGDPRVPDMRHAADILFRVQQIKPGQKKSSHILQICSMMKKKSGWVRI